MIDYQAIQNSPEQERAVLKQAFLLLSQTELMTRRRDILMNQLLSAADTGNEEDALRRIRELRAELRLINTFDATVKQIRKDSINELAE